MKRIFTKYICLFVLTFIVFHGNAQHQYSVHWKQSYINYPDKIVTYKIQIRNNSTVDWFLAGQNFRLFYGTEILSIIQDSIISTLPTNRYTDLAIVGNVENLDASGFGNLSFEKNLGFLNFYIDLNDLINGGIKVQPDSLVDVAKLSFSIIDKNSEMACPDLVFASEYLTASYANAFIITSEWVSPTLTSTLILDSVYSIFSQDTHQCIDFTEKNIITCQDNIDNDGDGDFDCDDFDCGRPQATNVLIQMPSQATCPELNDGQIVIESTNTDQFSKDGGLTFQSSNTFGGLTAGDYILVLRNSLTGCTIDTLVKLIAPTCNELCQDNIDNDGDGDIDCDDLDCGRPQAANVLIQMPSQAPCPELNDGQIVIESTNTDQYSKDGGLTFQSSNTFGSLTAGDYILVVRNSLTGCTIDTIVKLIAPTCNELCQDNIDNDGDGDIDCDDIDCPCDVQLFIIPNIFSPLTLDGINDDFYFHYNKHLVDQIHFWKIFDRWGNVLFNSTSNNENGTSESWIGSQIKSQNIGSGVYVLQINYTIASGERRHFVASITIL